MDQHKSVTAVMVVQEAGRVVGYYGLAPTAVLPTTSPRSVRTGGPCAAALRCRGRTDRRAGGGGACPRRQVGQVLGETWDSREQG